MTETREEIIDEKISELLTDAFPTQDPTAPQKARILSTITAKRRKPARRGQWRLAGLAAGITLLTGTVVVAPRWSAAQALRRMGTAMDQAVRVHTVVYQIGPDGKAQQKEETWQENGKRRTETSNLGPDSTPRLERVSLFANGYSWDYSPAGNRITRRRRSEGARYPSSGPTMSDLRRDIARYGWQDVVRELGETTETGRKARRFQIEREEPAGRIRMEIMVDTATDLPFRSELFLKTRESDRYVLRMRSEIAYNEAFAARLFHPDFPRTARIVDEDTGRQEWRERLSKGIARQNAPNGRALVLRDFTVNREGDLFLLYTAGKRTGDQFHAGNRYAGRDWRIEVTDEFGIRYVPYGFQLDSSLADGVDPSAMPQPGGERLEGDAWTPENRQALPWKPRRFTITFRVSQDNLHGTGEVGPVKYAAPIPFSLPVPQASSELLPEFAPYIAPDLTEKTIRREQASARGELPPDAKVSPELIQILPEFHDSIQTLAFLPDGKTLIGGAYNEGIRFWDVPNGRDRGEYGITGGEITVAVAPDGKHMAIYHSPYSREKRRYLAGTLAVRDIPSGRIAWQLALPEASDGVEPDKLSLVSVAPDGKTLTVTAYRVEERKKDASGRETVIRTAARLLTWDAATGKPLASQTIPDGMFAPTLSPRQDIAVTARQQLVPFSQPDGLTGNRVAGTEVKTWDARTGKLRHILETPESVSLRPVTISADGHWIAAGGTESKPGTIQHLGTILLVWDAQSGKLVQTLRGTGTDISSLAFSPDNRLLVAGDGQEITVWDMETGKRSKTLIGHGTSVTELVFAPGGHLLASGDLKGNICLWILP